MMGGIEMADIAIFTISGISVRILPYISIGIKARVLKSKYLRYAKIYFYLFFLI